ncbi:anti-sigma-D factor RsdA [Nocardia jejuensis]|uniref:anti-sigma-D factor RsdA n=1 Tax=Nocardia jejuensis TaxID=328049 RepID=UPI000A00B43F|nr:anti-sigma-D factor RsdA [Nocardia jejuensis]
MARDGERGRGDWKARSGSHNSGPYADASGGDTGPVDIAAVRRDDALIDAIAGDGPVQTGTSDEYQLAALLANWRAEIVAEPMPAGPDLDSIVAAVNQEIGARQARISAQSGGRLRLVRPLLGAAAALALVVGGLTAFSYSAEPGDPLWRVKEVVFSEQAQTTVVARADSDLAEAEQLIKDKKPEQAKAVMERASSNASQVNDSTKKGDLVDRWQVLLTQLSAVDPEIAKSLEPSAPVTTTPGKPSVTTVPTTVLLTPAPGTPDSTKPTVDPRTLDTTDPGGPGPSTGGPVTTLPNTPPPVTEPPTTVDPVEPSTVPVTPTAGNPQTGGPGTNPGSQEPVTQPPAEKPTAAPPVVPPTQQNSVPNGGISIPVPPPAGPTH